MESRPKELLEYVTSDEKCPFKDWMKALRDIKARAIIRVRLNRIILGNLGDCKSLGDGITELRIDFGPGYRIYFGQDGFSLIILLCAGSKKHQQKDIDTAKSYWFDYLRRKNETTY